MGSVAFRESIGRFLMKEEQSGRCRRGISRGIQSTRDPFEFQKRPNVLLWPAGYIVCFWLDRSWVCLLVLQQKVPGGDTN